MTAQDIILFWKEGCNEAWKTVEALIQSKRYVHALFFCHLTLEKLLKARYIERYNEPAPPIHDLLWFIDKIGVILSPEQRDALGTINTFNIAGRYEEQKDILRQQATASYAVEWMKQTDVLRNYLAH